MSTDEQNIHFEADVYYTENRRILGLFFKKSILKLLLALVFNKVSGCMRANWWIFFSPLLLPKHSRKVQLNSLFPYLDAKSKWNGTNPHW